MAPAPTDTLRTHELPTRILARGPSRQLRSLESLALFAAVMAKAEALELLGGLRTIDRGPALAFAKKVLELESCHRRARVEREFGERLDAPERLRVLFSEAPGLQREMYVRLPPYFQSAFPRLKGTVATPTESRLEVRDDIVSRLIREATR
jgi:hypothetical protein